MSGRAFLLVLAVVAALYASHVRSAGWVYEDFSWRHGAASVMSAMPTLRIMLSSLPNRHLTMWTFALSPDDPRVAHGINLALHLVNAVLLALLVTRWGGPGWVVGALFALHPLATEAVAYASGRSELLPAMALLGVCWVVTASTARAAWRWSALAVLVLLGAMTKPTFISALLLVAWIVWQRRGRALAGLLSAALLAAPFVALMAVRFLTRPRDEAFVPLGRWFTVQTAAGWTFFANALVPLHLSASHAWWTFPDGMQAAAVVALVGVLVWLARARSWIAFGVGWFWIAILPRLFVRDALGWMHEHHAYIPLIGMSIALGSLLVKENRLQA